MASALCVGGTSGIGRGMALHLAGVCKASVAIMGRNEAAGKSAVDEMKRLHPEGSHSFIQCDATSMSNIRQACRSLDMPVDYLVLSQGIASIKGRDETVEGIDRKLALHYYGRMQFIQSMLPHLNERAKDRDVRVMSILSAGMHSTYTNFQDMELKHNFSISNAATAAGFYNDLALDQLSRQNPNITFIHANPGVVNTNWGSEFPLPLRLVVNFLKIFATAPSECAMQLSKGLLEPEWKGGFRLMTHKATAAKTTSKHTEENMARVWQHTLDVLARTEKR
jgi:NAD(P)-dependent dehydrogenase (short-subunit alcohol dehydrogenase family)